MTTFKEVFNKKLNQEEIYQSVIHKNKRYDLKLVLVCACAILIISVLFKPNNEIKIGEHSLYVNKLNQSELINSDLDVKISTFASFTSDVIYSKFPFIKNLENYKNHEWDIYYMYVREDINSNSYTLLHDYVFTLKNNESTIVIAFSEIEPPLRCTIMESNKKESLINNVKLILQQFNDSYYVTFEHNGIYYDIETSYTSLEELVDVLEIITSY